MPVPGESGGGVDLVAAGVGADHDRALVFDQPLGGLEVGPGRVVRGDLGVVGAVLAPEPAGPGADQHDVARRERARPPRRACPARSLVEMSVWPGRASTFLKAATSISTPRAMIGGIVEASHFRGPQSPPHSDSLKPLYQWKSRPGRDVGQAVDLGRHVIRDEQRGRMPVDVVRVLARRAGHRGLSSGGRRRGCGT